MKRCVAYEQDAAASIWAGLPADRSARACGETLHSRAEADARHGIPHRLYGGRNLSEIQHAGAPHCPPSRANPPICFRGKAAPPRGSGRRRAKCRRPNGRRQSSPGRRTGGNVARRREFVAGTECRHRCLGCSFSTTPARVQVSAVTSTLDGSNLPRSLSSCVNWAGPLFSSPRKNDLRAPPLRWETLTANGPTRAPET